jgi:NIMA (never in mitosis gene a)-related kinase 2
MSSKERDQLHAEFSILASLKHDNIVGYYHREHLKQTQELYLYMEYCGGGDLGSIIKDLKKKREYPKEEFVWRILSQLVTALYRCHYGVDPPEPGSDFARQKDTRIKAKDMILHRDLKPENIFLGADQAVKLGDFGLSKLMQSHDFASTYVGTPFYMSPEICASERYTLLSDIWSVGCIIYELCTHNPPFNANSHLQLIQRIRKGDFAPIPSVYSKDLSNVISQCLKVNPNNRPDTASLLTVPYIWLARRQQEMVGLGKALKTREEVAEQKLRQAEERLSAMEADQAAMRIEIENQVRREWEVKARLEITRQVNLEMERLRAQFDDEVEKKVAAVLNDAKHSENGSAKENTARSQKGYSSSVNTMGEEEFPSTTDLTDLSELSIHSPTSSTIKPLPQKKTKTPFSRSKTTFDSPMDVQMSEPSPMSISGLALSPRRNAAAQATANATTTAYGVRNIFAEAARQKARWEPTLAYESENDENIDPDDDFSDDDGIPELPSPTRVKPTVASTDPFKQPLPPRTRPALGRVHTVAATQRLTTKPNLFPTNNLASAKAEAVKASIAAANAQSTYTNIPRSATETELAARRPTSPSRRLSKIPTQPLDSAFIGSTSPIRRTNTTGGGGKLQSKLASARDGNAPAVGGRTLVELAQARAGGRPMSGDFASNGNNGYGNGTLKSKQQFGIWREEKDLPPVPVWDPDTEGDNMPSPFLKRDVRSLPRGLR